MNKTLAAATVGVCLCLTAIFRFEQSVAREAAEDRALSDVQVLIKDACCGAPFAGRNPAVHWMATESDLQLDASFDVDLGSGPAPVRLVGTGPLRDDIAQSMSGSLVIAGQTLPAVVDVGSASCDQAECWRRFRAETTNGRKLSLVITGSGLAPTAPPIGAVVD